jgi:hypothetical protein
VVGILQTRLKVASNGLRWRCKHLGGLTAEEYGVRRSLCHVFLGDLSQDYLVSGVQVCRFGLLSCRKTDHSGRYRRDHQRGGRDVVDAFANERCARTSVRWSDVDRG